MRTLRQLMAQVQHRNSAVYVTDLDVYSADFGDEPLFAVLWAVHGDPRELRQRIANVPFGECIEIAE